MFVAFDQNDRVIAYHDRKKVVAEYIENLKSSNGISLHLKKIRKKDEHHYLYGKEDLYLMVYGKTFIQSGYIKYLELNGADQLYDDTQYAIDILYRLLEIHDVGYRKEKIVKKAIKVLESVLDDDIMYTPTLKELNAMRDHYEPYLLQTRFPSCD